jgi:hypothetical protein
VQQSATRGYFLSVPATLDPLPAGFTQAVLHARTISCSTEEVLYSPPCLSLSLSSLALSED